MFDYPFINICDFCLNEYLYCGFCGWYYVDFVFFGYDLQQFNIKAFFWIIYIYVYVYIIYINI